MKLTRNKFVYYLGIILFAFLIVLIGYFTPRTEYSKLYLLYTLGFICYIYLFINGKEPLFLKAAIIAAIAVRLILIIMSPNLSDDYFRFIWDGLLINNNINPYNYIPTEIFNDESVQFPLKTILYDQLNSLQRSNYSCYTALNQLFFAIPAYFFPSSIKANIIIMRLFIFLAEAGTIIFGIKTLKLLDLSSHKILIYALNPLVIIELCGNLHFEAIMLFFLVTAIYYILKNQYLFAATFFGLSVSVKIVPVILIFIFYKRLGLKKWVIFSLISGVISFIFVLAIPISGNNLGFFNSMNLYFQTFEFNASIYYLLRYLGFKIVGYNLIAYIGPILSLISIIIIVLFSSLRKNRSPHIMTATIVLAYATFYFLSTTVHPWYITILLGLTIYSNFRFPIIWSYMLILSYYTYTTPDFLEPTILLFIEYGIVFLVLFLEVFLYERKGIKVFNN